MLTILDQSADVNFRELHKYAQLYLLPDFVKQAAADDVYGPAERTSRLFADTRPPCQFPTHTKAATLVSTIFFLEKQSQISPKVRPHIAERLAKSARFWGIGNAVSRIYDKHAELSKEAEYPDDAYAIVFATPDGRKERRYPLRNSLEVKAAAEWFQEHLPALRQQFGFSDRQTIANKILEKAAEFGVSIWEQHDLLEKTAGRGLGSPKAAASVLRTRVKAAAKIEPGTRAAMNKLAEAVESKPSIFLDPATMSQLAHTIDSFDRTHGLLNKYSSTIPAPEDVLFGCTYSKTAALKDCACRLTTGTVYDRSDFSKLSTTDVRDTFGDEVADAVTTGLKVDIHKMAEVAATLPRAEAEDLQTLLAEKGIEHMAKESADHHLGFSHEQYQQMAA